MQVGKHSAVTQCFAKVGLTAGTTTTYTTGVATDFVINGVFGTQFATKTNQATPTTDVNTGAAFTALAANEGAVYVFGTDSSGAVKVAGSKSYALDSSGEFKVRPQFPPIPETMCPFGYFVILNGSTGSAWTLGSSNWTAAGITDTTTNCAVLPNRPVDS